MRIRSGLLVQMVCAGVFVCGPVMSSVAQQISNETRKQAGSLAPIAKQQTDVNVLPDSPGATLAQAQTPAFPQRASQTQTGETQSNQSAGSQTQANQVPASQVPANQVPANQPTPQRPVGTAAAEAPSTSGIAASEPAGVAIAPAKQRRTRAIIIKTGAIIGAAVAVGVVVALTEATPSKPPGAH